MSDLSSFADLVRKGAEDKKIKEAQKVATTAPLLSELFSTIAKGKEAKKEIVEKEAPLLNELQEALSNPQKFKESKKEKKEKILELVSELEEKAANIQSKLDSVQETPVESTKTDPETVLEEVEAAPTDLEKKFLKLFNRLQADFQTLKKHVDTRVSSVKVSAVGGGGSGEVRILRMDDVSKTAPVHGDVLVWDSILNKFKPVQLPTGGSGGTVTDEEMPYAKRVDFISDDILYKGEAAVGSPESAPVWRIHKIVIGADNDVTETWASGISTYSLIWDNRASYTYS